MDYDDFTEHASDRPLTPLNSPDINDIVGAPQLDPRVGHEYQVEVPPMIKESELLKLLMNPAESEPGVHYNEANANMSSISENATESRPTTFQSGIAADNKGDRLRKSGNYVMAPGTLSSSWSDSDVKSFVLGLFIFGKSFIQIKNFLENKGMADILSFYYGKFYKSDEYRRWNSCKKLKGRKCVTGHKLFTGRRQHELLSRLIPRVSEEIQDTLQQISKSYMDGRTSLEEYIWSLKSTVGLDVLVEAVGIGKGKEGLTSFSAEPGKNNRVLSIPSSKAWSSLGLGDIVNILTGGFRLSKAKSSDLFWEAVWPRLLARGWHSEQPNSNHGYVSSKDFLVFLVPGVKKFSRRKLVKGDQYFNSFSDVLSKVAAEPNLLELEGEEGKAGSCNDEEMEKGLTENDQSGKHHHRYLKPRAPTSNTDPMKFIVADTSLGAKSSDLRKSRSISDNSAGKIEIDSDSRLLTMLTVVDTSFPDEGKNSSTVRELGYPLVELEDTSKMNGIAREIDRSSSDDNSSSKTEATIVSMLISRKKNVSNADCEKGTRNRDSTIPKEAYSNRGNNANKVAESCQNQQIGLSDGNQLKRTLTIKHQFCRRSRSGHSNLAVHPIKRRRLTACFKAETSRTLENSKKNAGDPVSDEQNVGLVHFSAEGSVEENNEGSILKRVCLDKKSICCDVIAKRELHPLVNFDASQVPPKSEDGEMMAVMEEDEQQLKPNDIVPRRQSTRNRPLTVRAMECIANEFLHVKTRQKRKGAAQTPKDSSGTCRRGCAGANTTLNCHSSGHETAISTSFFLLPIIHHN